MGLRSFICFIIVGLFLVSCNETLLKNAGGAHPLDPFACGKTPIAYSSVFNQVILRNCISCHAAGNSTGVSLSTYVEVKANAARIKDSVLSDRMPEAGPLSITDKVLLVSWINQGAPERAEEAHMECAEQAPEDPLLEPTYESLHTKVFLKNCNGCHHEEGRLKDFSSYEAITSSANAILFDKEVPEESEFVKRLITNDLQKVMPPQRTGMDKLSPEVVSVIKEWIARGMPKN